MELKMRLEFELCVLYILSFFISIYIGFNLYVLLVLVFTLTIDFSLTIDFCYIIHTLLLFVIVVMLLVFSIKTLHKKLNILS